MQLSYRVCPSSPERRSPCILTRSSCPQSRVVVAVSCRPEYLSVAMWVAASLVVLWVARIVSSPRCVPSSPDRSSLGARVQGSNASPLALRLGSVNGVAAMAGRLGLLGTVLRGLMYRGWGILWFLGGTGCQSTVKRDGRVMRCDPLLPNRDWFLRHLVRGATPWCVKGKG